MHYHKFTCDATGCSEQAFHLFEESDLSQYGWIKFQMLDFSKREQTAKYFCRTHADKVMAAFRGSP